MPELARIPNDKLNHIVAFFVLAFLFNGSCPGWSAIVRFCILLGFGIFLETVQLVLGYREFSWLDLLADALGIVAFYSCRVWALNLKHWAAGKTANRKAR